jgi:hypothetical protein
VGALCGKQVGADGQSDGILARGRLRRDSHSGTKDHPPRTQWWGARAWAAKPSEVKQYEEGQ